MGIKHMYRGVATWQIAVGIVATLMAIVAIAAGEFGVAAGIMAAEGGALTIDDLTKLVETKGKALDAATTDLRELAREVNSKMANGEKLYDSLKEATDKQMVTVNEIQLALKEIEQKMAQRGNDDRQEVKSFGVQVIESDEFKRFTERGSRGQFSLELKQVDSVAAGAGIIRSQRENEIVRLRRERLVVRDLLTVVPISTSSVDYPVQLTRTNNAATYLEGAVRAYSDYTWGQQSVTVKNIGHLAKLTKQALEDAPRLRGEVDSEMRYGLAQVEDTQLLNGNNTGANLHGIIPQASAFASPIAGLTSANGYTKVDVLRAAILQIALNAPMPADGIVLNTADWAAIEMLKDANGVYLFGGPQGSTAPRLWGLPVVDTTAITSDTFLVGNFTAGATLYDRMGVEALISTENADDFEKRLVTLSVDERIALAVKRPGCFVTGDFSVALTGV